MCVRGACCSVVWCIRDWLTYCSCEQPPDVTVMWLCSCHDAVCCTAACSQCWLMSVMWSCSLFSVECRLHRWRPEPKRRHVRHHLPTRWFSVLFSRPASSLITICHVLKIHAAETCCPHIEDIKTKMILPVSARHHWACKTLYEVVLNLKCYLLHCSESEKYLYIHVEANGHDWVIWIHDSSRPSPWASTPCAPAPLRPRLIFRSCLQSSSIDRIKCSGWAAAAVHKMLPSDVCAARPLYWHTASDAALRIHVYV